jgi:putative serine protease PepD
MNPVQDQPAHSAPDSQAQSPAWWAGPTPKPKRSQVPLGSALILAVVAGVVGSAVGNVTGSNTVFGHHVNLVSSSSSVERKADSVAGIAQRVLPSVVSIATDSSSGSASGSGFIIESSGYILTNNHVVDGAVNGGTLTVTLNSGKSYTASIVGRDTSYDLAVIKIAAQGLPALQFGDSDKVQVGDAVIAVGSPLGLAGTVTSGIISAKNRAVTAGDSTGESSFINALQTDAAINPGNSGGPLVDATGAVIGVNSAIASLGSSYGSQSGSIGLGFAIPINQARKTADQLIKTGKATYPIMGISIDRNYSGVGAKVAGSAGAIKVGGPAEKAGLKIGDIITKFDGKTINNADELIVAVRARSVGDTVSVTYLRDGTSHEVSVTLVAAQ